ncbi:MAG: hypothetical protein E7515_01015 [Ruminococcaceae bacterium]|nr:hypothetical protein [Oscillospiraceae bacterium]
MIKILCVSVVSVVFLQILKQYKSDYAIIFKLAVIVFIGFLIIEELNSSVLKYSFITDLSDNQISYFPIIIKVLGIVIITQLGSNICKESGEESLSMLVELIGKVTILIICIPLIEALYTLVKGYLEL